MRTFAKSLGLALALALAPAAHARSYDTGSLHHFDLASLHGVYPLQRTEFWSQNWSVGTNCGAALVSTLATYNLFGDTASSSACTPSSSTSVRDASGNGNTATWNGTQSGTSYWYSSGPNSTYPYAAYFNGTDNSISLPTTLLNTLTAGTFVFNVYPTAISTCALGYAPPPWQCTTLLGVDSNYLSVLIPSSGHLEAYYYDGSYESFYATGLIAENVWNCVAVAWDSTGMSIYLGGVLDSSTTQTFTNTNSGHVGQPAWIGRQGGAEGGGGPYWYAGKMAPVLMYNSKLSNTTTPSISSLCGAL